MSATDKVKTGSEHTEPRTYEPSMEEILASIRRIIADDHTLPGRSQERDGEANLRAALEGAQVRSTGGYPAPQDKPTFLRGTADSAAVYRHPANGQATVAAPRAESISQAPRPAPQQDQPPLMAQPQGRIAAPQFAMPDAPAPRPAGLQHETYAEPPAPEPVHETPVAEAPLAHQTVEPQPGPDAGASPVLLSEAASHAVLEAFGRLTASKRAERDAFIQEITGELLRPMLKTWLDENLPGLVERLVQAEIERLHGRR